MSKLRDFASVAVRGNADGYADRPTGTKPVRYASVRTGPVARTGAEKATDGAGGSGYADRPPGFLALTWHFRIPTRYHRLPRAGLGLGGPQGRDPHASLDPAQQPRFPVRRPVFDEVPR
jgi:hypothetical protein